MVHALEFLSMDLYNSLCNCPWIFTGAHNCPLAIYRASVTSLGYLRGPWPWYFFNNGSSYFPFIFNNLSYYPWILNRLGHEVLSLDLKLIFIWSQINALSVCFLCLARIKVYSFSVDVFVYSWENIYMYIYMDVNYAQLFV